eukprot:GFUD01026725.1.p1 GENE.GFUD01026725.1~~GFUD01026725.1.p1  ORF type:complete len:407 (+),score=101.90 GFUD01026725.1:197-1417(+)
MNMSASSNINTMDNVSNYSITGDGGEGMEECGDVCWEVYVGFWIEGLLVPVIASFGIVGNITCVFVFNHKSVDLKPSFSNILKCLSIYDILFLSGVIFLYALPNMSNYYIIMIEPHTTPLILPLTQVAMTGSVYSVVAVAVERYFNICKPFHNNWGGMYQGLGYIIAIIIFSFLYNILKFFELETVYPVVAHNSTNETFFSSVHPEAAVQLTDMRRNPVYTTTYIICNTFFMGVFPILVLAILNCKIIQAMKRATMRHNNVCTVQRRDGAMTALLSGIVLVLVICHTPKTFINLYESYQVILWGELRDEPLWGRILIKCSHLLLSVSSALNIVIYSYKDFKFRAVLGMFCRNISDFKKTQRREGSSVTDGDVQGTTTITEITVDDSPTVILGYTNGKEMITHKNNN